MGVERRGEEAQQRWQHEQHRGGNREGGDDDGEKRRPAFATRQPEAKRILRLVGQWPHGRIAPEIYGGFKALTADALNITQARCYRTRVKA